MPEDRRHADVAAAIESIATRSHTETALLIAKLGRMSWPRGIADRTEPPALEWVRRWGPSRLTSTPLDCSCSEGRCTVCN